MATATGPAAPPAGPAMVARDITNAPRPDAPNPVAPTPVEMTDLSSQLASPAASSEGPTQPAPSSSLKENLPPPAESLATGAPIPQSNISPPSTLNPAQSTAIGPSSDSPMPLPKDELSGPTLMITLLLTTGARHPFKLDQKYLSKRNVDVQGNDPFNLSVYKLKELILREWRDGME